MAAWTDRAEGADMLDDDNILRSSRQFRLTADVTTLMLKGAGYAALFCVAILFAGLLLLAISRALPEASKQAADPTPDLSLALPPERVPLA